MPAWLITSGAAATTPGCLRMIRSALRQSSIRRPAPNVSTRRCGVGHQNPLPQVVPQAVHDAQHHDQRDDPTATPPVEITVLSEAALEPRRLRR